MDIRKITLGPGKKLWVITDKEHGKGIKFPKHPNLLKKSVTDLTDEGFESNVTMLAVTFSKTLLPKAYLKAEKDNPDQYGIFHISPDYLQKFLDRFAGDTPEPETKITEPAQAKDSKLTQARNLLLESFDFKATDLVMALTEIYENLGAICEVSSVDGYNKFFVVSVIVEELKHRNLFPIQQINSLLVCAAIEQCNSWDEHEILEALQSRGTYYQLPVPPLSAVIRTISGLRERGITPPVKERKEIISGNSASLQPDHSDRPKPAAHPNGDGIIKKTIKDHLSDFLEGKTVGKRMNHKEFEDYLKKHNVQTNRRYVTNLLATYRHPQGKSAAVKAQATPSISPIAQSKKCKKTSLPDKIVAAILEYYGNKTIGKRIDGKERQQIDTFLQGKGFNISRYLSNFLSLARVTQASQSDKLLPGLIPEELEFLNNGSARVSEFPGLCCSLAMFSNGNQQDFSQLLDLAESLPMFN